MKAPDTVNDPTVSEMEAEVLVLLKAPDVTDGVSACRMQRAFPQDERPFSSCHLLSTNDLERSLSDTWQAHADWVLTWHSVLNGFRGWDLVR
ncbi:uncharacterized protein HKW66_Vig0029600 [Vigna angularis]|uniref:Uncharacterized protein n=1 Tax=Phaseolus angularis TaxID=3914 RepID=A0A8T0LBF7_PHAAN|nr:uncharacterized protein HKW66_Vig0029600 [Vigna angularis]